MLSLSVWLEFEGGSTIGPQDVRLLEEIAKRSSISAASRTLEASYWSTWRRVRMLNALLDAPVVEVEVGGRLGGLAWLTPHGRRFVKVYRMIERDALAATRANLQDVTSAGHRRGSRKDEFESKKRSDGVTAGSDPRIRHGRDLS